MTTATMNRTASAPFDAERQEVLGERLVRMMNEAGLTFMLSIGHRTGLFDTMAEMDWASSEQIAAAADLNERYVREWLGAMVTGLFVEYDPQERTYRLPPEHASLLTRVASPNNVAQSMQWMSVLGRAEDGIVEHFKTGGGLHYHCYHRFNEAMAAESDQTVVAALEEHILPLVPGLKDQLVAGIDVLDIGCGAGMAMCKLAAMYPNSRFRGYDGQEEAIAFARREAQRLELTNVHFEVRDVSDLGHTADFDLITGFDVIHDQRDPAGVLAQVKQALRPAGVFLMQDINASSHLEKNIDHPLGAFLYTISTMHCMSVSLAQGGAGLGTCWGEELALQMIADAGFGDTQVHRLPHDIQNNFYVNRP